MNCRRYRMCLVGLIVIALICGIYVYVKQVKESEIPADGMLVKNCRDIGDETEKWV